MYFKRRAARGSIHGATLAARTLATTSFHSHTTEEVRGEIEDEVRGE
jgi:hypothetical protein